MKQAASQTLYAYWNEVRGERLAPSRFEIDPSRIGGILADTFILERVDSETARFRLAGTRICEAFGVEFRGVNLLDVFSMEDRATLKRQIESTVRQGAVGVFSLQATAGRGHDARFEMILLPLTHNSGAVDRLLGALAPLDEPSWLGAPPISRVSIVACDPIWPDGRPHSVINAMGRQSPFLPAMRQARIVRSDRRQFRVYEGGLGRDDD